VVQKLIKKGKARALKEVGGGLRFMLKKRARIKRKIPDKREEGTLERKTQSTTKRGQRSGRKKGGGNESLSEGTYKHSVDLLDN